MTACSSEKHGINPLHSGGIPAPIKQTSLFTYLTNRRSLNKIKSSPLIQVPHTAEVNLLGEKKNAMNQPGCYYSHNTGTAQFSCSLCSRSRICFTTGFCHRAATRNNLHPSLRFRTGLSNRNGQNQNWRPEWGNCIGFVSSNVLRASQVRPGPPQSNVLQQNEHFWMNLLLFETTTLTIKVRRFCAMQTLRPTLREHELQSWWLKNLVSPEQEAGYWLTLGSRNELKTQTGIAAFLLDNNKISSYFTARFTNHQPPSTTDPLI